MFDGMVGKRAVSFWVYFEFIAARLPTLQKLVCIE